MDSVVGTKQPLSFEAVTDFIKTFLKDELMVECSVNDIGIDQGLQVDLGLDSIAFLELRSACEEKYDLEITDDEFSPDHFSSIRGVASLIMTKL
jgi:acyl carrier protein